MFGTDFFYFLLRLKSVQGIEYKVKREVLGDGQQCQVCMGNVWKQSFHMLQVPGSIKNVHCNNGNNN